MSDIFIDHEFNCRGRVKPLDVSDLVQSIRQVGLQQPILVQRWDKTPGKRYRIVAGHRRYVAMLILEKKEIQAFVNEDLSDMDAYKINLMENIARSDLNLVQEARGLLHLRGLGLSQEEIAKELTQTRGWVQIRMMVLELPKDIQDVVAAGFLTQTEIRQLHGLPVEKQYEAVRIIKEHKLRGERIELNLKPKKPQPFARKERKRHDIIKMQSMIRTAIGPCFGTRTLAWCLGEISDFELCRDLKEEANKIGKNFEYPKEMMEI